MKKVNEAELFTRLMTPLVEEIGLNRTTAAMGEASKILNMLEPNLKPETEQLAMDTMYVVEHWCRTIREMIAEEEKADSAKA